MALQQQNSPSPNTSAERLSNVEMSLEALRNVIKNNPGMYVTCLSAAAAESRCVFPETSTSVLEVCPTR